MPEPIAVAGDGARRFRAVLGIGSMVFSLIAQAADNTPGFAGGRAAPDERSGLSLTLTWASDYLFRGVSLSNRLPVVQGSLDFETPLRWGVAGNIGLWLSRVRLDSIETPAPAGVVPQSKREQGIYFGLSGSLVAGIDWSAQIEKYTYPGYREFDHEERRLALSREFKNLHFTPAVEVARTRFRSVFYPGSDGHYEEINLRLKPAALWGLSGHLGRSRYASQALGDQDYVDRSVTLSSEIDACRIEFVASSTNTRQFGRLGDSTLLVRIGRSF